MLTGIFGPLIQSLEVDPDGRVSFRLAAPRALDVAIDIGTGASPLQLRSDDGLRTGASAPLAPDLYCNVAVVDRVCQLDSSAPEGTKERDLEGLCTNLPESREVRDVIKFFDANLGKQKP